MSYILPCIYEVYYIEQDYDRSKTKKKLNTFDTEQKAISYIVDLYGKDLIEKNKFAYVGSNYYYRKRYKDMCSRWIRFEIKDLQEYIENNNVKNNQIIHFLTSYNKWLNDRSK